MRKVAIVLGVMMAVGTAQDEERVTETERSRFVFFAVLEGLWEDGADPALVRPIAEDTDGYFVPKCPICLPVQHAASVYVTSGDVPAFSARGKSGWPAEIADGMKGRDLNGRRAALERMVARYVDRRFDRLRFADARRDAMKESLRLGMKQGMRLFGESPLGEYKKCPSCAGAAEAKK